MVDDFEKPDEDAGRSNGSFLKLKDKEEVTILPLASKRYLAKPFEGKGDPKNRVLVKCAIMGKGEFAIWDAAETNYLELSNCMNQNKGKAVSVTRVGEGKRTNYLVKAAQEVPDATRTKIKDSDAAKDIDLERVADGVRYRDAGETKPNASSYPPPATDDDIPF